MQITNETNINIIRAIILSATVMLLSLFFFIPYITEKVTIEEVSNYILVLFFIVSSIVFFLLSRVLLSNERTLKKQIVSQSDELKTLSTLINDKMISSKMNIEGEITYVSQALVAISGYMKDELIGKSFSKLRHPDMNKKVYDELWGKLKKGESWSGDLLKQAKDGSSYYVHTTVFPTFDKNKNIVGYTSFSEDISEKILIEKKLESERVFKETIFDNQDEIIFISSFKEGVVNINQKFFRVFDYKDLEDFKSRHRTVCELFSKKEGYLECSETGKYWSDILLKKPKLIHKALMYNKHNEERIFRVRIKEITVANEKYHITTFSNITELEKARELAESSEKAKAAFMANMSHELRTPLNGIDGFVQLLSKTTLNEKQKKYISLILTSSNNLIGIVNDILDFSKIESGKMTLSCVEVNPFVEFENILELFTAKTEEKNIEYSTEIDLNIPTVIKVDTLRISQVLSNLIGNAIKFTPNDGVIKVKINVLKIDEEFLTLQFSVKDSGIGIPKERQELIFEAFTQADDSTTREFGGTGLGLNISLSLIELMGGTLDLQSAENEGSTFSFTIKSQLLKQDSRELIDVVESTKVVEPVSSNVNKIEKTFKILVVEDNEMNQILMNELLKSHELQMNIDFVLNGEEAIAKVFEENYDLIFMDINMPVLNGIDTTKFIRQSANDVPIIALTANSLEGDREKFLSAGMNDYLSKPLQYEKFDKIIHKYLE